MAAAKGMVCNTGGSCELLLRLGDLEAEGQQER